MTHDGTRIQDRYELLERLGGGDGSATYRAVDHDTGQACVVKVLSVGAVVRTAGRTHSFDGDDFTKLVELFEREARVLAHLDHPGIPRFIDHFAVSEDDDVRLYTVQERVDGRTLASLVEDGRHFTEPEARELCRQAAEILAYLHGRSPPLIHRDVKPSNIVLGDGDVLHLVDFGSVRNAIGGDELDGKTIVGTYGYMPIEQYEARALPQSDLYALGMTLIHVLSHRSPTDLPRVGMSLEFRQSVHVSDRFAAILDRLIEPAPEDRYGSAAELLLDLEGRALAPTSAPWEVARRRSRVVLASLAAFMIAAIGAFLSLSSVGVPATDAGPDAVAELIEPTGERRPARPVSPEDGRLAVDIYRDFTYRPVGWPMGRSVGQTPLPRLTSEPFEDLRTPRSWRSRDTEVHHGFFPLGNGPDRRVAFALVNERGVWSLSVDLDNNEDLTDDGPPVYNEGTGEVLAAEVAPRVDVVASDGATVRRPYHLWAWFDEPDDDGRIRGRFYARNHYQGTITVGDAAYDAAAFEFRDHDALYRDSGLCIDLDGDGECSETEELFRDGDVVPFPDGDYPLALRYP